MFTCCRSAKEAPGYLPAALAGGYSVVIHHQPPADVVTPPQQGPPTRQPAGLDAWAAHRARPVSVRFEAVTTSRQVLTPVPRVYLFALLAVLTPSDSSGPPRLCQGCFPPTRTSLRADCPQLRGSLLRQEPRRWSLTPARTTSASWRTVTS